MSGTIVIETNLDGLYYNLSTKDAGGKTEYVEFHTRLPKGETEVTVDGDGHYQVTIIDISNYYGGGQYSEGFYLADGETICVSKCFYDADGNDLEPSRPVETIAPPSDPKTPEPPETPSQPEEPASQPSEGGYLLDLISWLVKAILRLFKRT